MGEDLDLDPPKSFRDNAGERRRRDRERRRARKTPDARTRERPTVPRHGWRFFSHPWVDVDRAANHSRTRAAKCMF